MGERVYRASPLSYYDFMSGRIANSARFYTGAALFCAALVGFVITAGILHLLFFSDVLHLYAAMRSEKLLFLEETRGTYNAAVFGSSRVHTGLNPHVFDAAFTSTHAGIHSINLGVLGGSQTEERALAREFVRQLPADCGPDACMIFFEYNAGLNQQPEYLFNPRVINLYTPDAVKFAMRFSSSPGATAWQRVGRDGYALLAGTFNFVNLGMLSSAVFRPPVDQRLLASYTRNDQRGMLVEPPEGRDTAIVREDFEHYRQSNRPPVSSDASAVQPGAYQLLQDTTAFSSGHPLRFFYFVSPTLNDLWQVEQTPCSIAGPAGAVPIFNLARPDRYPELFHAELWRDVGHLNEKGAALFSTLLAKEVSAWLDGRSPRQCGG